MVLSAEIVFGVNLLIWSSSLALAMLADFARLHANQLVCPTVRRRQTFVKGNGVWSHFWGPRSGQRQGTPNEKFAKPWASPTKGGSTTESVSRYTVRTGRITYISIFGPKSVNNCLNNSQNRLRIIIRGVPSQESTGLDTYQICIQARFDTYQIPFLT